MSAVTLYLLLKYLAVTRPLTPLIITKKSKKCRFLSFFVQSCPVSGQYRPDGWSDGQNFYFKTDRTKFPVDPYSIYAYPMSQFLKVQTNKQTHKHTNKQTS